MNEATAVETELVGRLRAWREQAGLSQRRAAERLGVSDRALWSWEHGRSRPSRMARERIERELAGVAAGSEGGER